MKKLIAIGLLLAMLLCSAFAVEQNPYLDIAFTCLEEGNPILERYEEQTGVEIELEMSCGVPYFFGGQDYRKFKQICKITQISKYGNVGDKYIYGFDCTGYIRWIQDKIGDVRCPGLSDMIVKRSAYKKYRLENLLFEGAKYKPSYYDKDGLTTSTAPEIAKQLQVGDLLVGKHSGRHILMYIGTLRDYGYSEGDAPELDNYLDYPLMINCGNDPNYKERTAAYLEENGLTAKPSNGGVTISIVGMPVSEAPHQREDAVKEFYYFELGDYQLSVYDVMDCSSYILWRTVDEDRGTGKAKWPEYL